MQKQNFFNLDFNLIFWAILLWQSKVWKPNLHSIKPEILSQCSRYLSRHFFSLASHSFVSSVLGVCLPAASMSESIKTHCFLHVQSNHTAYKNNSPSCKQIVYASLRHIFANQTFDYFQTLTQLDYFIKYLVKH